MYLNNPLCMERSSVVGFGRFSNSLSLHVIFQDDSEADQLELGLSLTSQEI
jgi:hypothetical protein